MKRETILVINPGSTSTKIGLFDREGPIHVVSLDHTNSEICRMHSIKEQLPLRLEIVHKTFQPWLEENKLVAVVGRGGLVGPIASGVYAINEDFKEITINCEYAKHASNLGASIADGIAKEYHVPGFIADPVTVDEFIPEARLSGLPEFERRSRLHALNIKACVRKAAEQLNKNVEDTNFVVVHMGGGISVAAVRQGRIIDCNDALMGMGPFAPERTGALPSEGLIRLVLSGKYTFDDLSKKLTKNAGVKAYLGTSNMKEVEKRVEDGDKKAGLVLGAMIYQVAKEIGAMATTMNGNLNGIIMTGGLAHSQHIVNSIAERTAFIAKQIVFPGENELEALAECGFLAIDGKTEIKTYKKQGNHYAEEF